MKLLRSLDKAVFGWGSPVTMGLVRIAFGFLGLVNFLMIAVDFDAWFTERGFVPAWHAEKWQQIQDRWVQHIWRIDLIPGVTDTRVTAAVYVLTLLACFLTMIGLWTRIASVAMFVLVTTLHFRNPQILHSGDTLLRQFTFLVAIAPSGASCSVDRLIALWKGKAPREPRPVSLWPQRLMQYQVALLYFTTVLHKIGGSHWRDGTAFYFMGQLHEFDRFPAPEFVHHQPFVALATYGTLIIELALATIVFNRKLRKYAIVGGIVLHVLIEYMANIPLFEWVMMSTYLSFFYGDEVTAWSRKLGQKLKRLQASVTLPKGTELDPRGRSFLEALDVFGVIRYVPGANDWQATGADGRVLDPFRATLKASPGAWALGLLPGVWKRMVVSCTRKAMPESSSLESMAEPVSP